MFITERGPLRLADQLGRGDQRLANTCAPIAAKLSWIFARLHAAACARLVALRPTNEYPPTSSTIALMMRPCGTAETSRTPVERSKAEVAGTQPCASAKASNASGKSVRVKALADANIFTALSLEK